MRDLSLRFNKDDEVKLLLEERLNRKEISGRVLDETMRHGHAEYIIETVEGKWQLPENLVSYFNSKQLPSKEGYISVNDSLPELDHKVIIESDGNKEIKHLQLNTSGVISGSGYRTASLDWYPGGTPIGNSRTWCEIP